MLQAYADDMQGVDYVFHTASPFITDVADAKKQLIEPAVGGTENVLSSVAKHSKTIKRVVLTSSFAGEWSAVVLVCTAKHRLGFLASIPFLQRLSYLCMLAAIVKPKAGPSSDLYSENDWNTEVDENAQGADAYRYSKVRSLLCAAPIFNCMPCSR